MLYFIPVFIERKWSTLEQKNMIKRLLAVWLTLWVQLLESTINVVRWLCADHLQSTAWKTSKLTLQPAILIDQFYYLLRAVGLPAFLVSSRLWQKARAHDHLNLSRKYAVPIPQLGRFPLRFHIQGVRRFFPNIGNLPARPWQVSKSDLNKSHVCPPLSSVYLKRCGPVKRNGRRTCPCPGSTTGGHRDCPSVMWEAHEDTNAIFKRVKVESEQDLWSTEYFLSFLRKNF